MQAATIAQCMNVLTEQWRVFQDLQAALMVLYFITLRLHVMGSPAHHMTLRKNLLVLFAQSKHYMKERVTADSINNHTVFKTVLP